MAKWLDATVADRTDWNDHLFSLRFACDEFPTFEAGQFTKVGVEIGDNKVLSRPYSLVNAPNQSLPEILAVPVEEGQLSPKLHALKVGAPVKIMAPATGFLTLQEVPQSEVLWCFATGTGVGPFISILRQADVWQRYPQVVLVYAVRFFDDLAYLPELQQMQAQHAGFKLLTIVSRETQEGCLRGRIPQLLNDGVLEQAAHIPLNADTAQVMLCGNPAMIQETIDMLENRGLKKHLRRAPGQITQERYW